MALPTSTNALPGYLPLWQKTPPSLTDLVLIYQGGVQRPRWTTNRFAPYITCQDPQTGREQWAFDGFLFVEFEDGRGYSYVPQAHRRAARQTEWRWLLDRNFATNDGVPILEQSCQAASARIGQPQRRRQVILSLPEPISNQSDWGTADGRKLNFHQTADRVAACTWYLDLALEKWRELAPPELELAGFYWIDENTPLTNGFLQQVAQRVHERGRQFFWIPYWQPKHLPVDWRGCGFDMAWLQPNYFFQPKVPGTRLQNACDFAKAHGLGLEMEFDGRVLSQAQVFEPRFQAYLDAFTRTAVSRTSTMAWYEGGGTLFQLANSPKPNARRLYDRLSQFVLERQHMADKQARAAFAAAAN